MQHLSILDTIGQIIPNRTDHDRLLKKLFYSSKRRSISVTDLLSPRQAYFERINPEIKESFEELERKTAGSGFHDLFGRMVSNKEFREQFVERDGVTGKIDIYQDIPIELKTTTVIGDIINPISERPEYFIQLGLYCAITEIDHGLLIIKINDNTPGNNNMKIRVFDVRFKDINTLFEDMKKRGNDLKDALEQKDPNNLPRCRWYCQECRYNVVCDYNAADTKTEYPIERFLEMEEKKELALEYMKKLESFQFKKVTTLFKINDLITPRKKFFDVINSEKETVKNRGEGTLEWMTTWSKQKEMEKKIFRHDKEKPSEVKRYNLSGENKMMGIITTWNDYPVIFKQSDSTHILDTFEIPKKHSWQIEQLAIECCLLDKEKGKLIINYEKIIGDSAKMQCYDIYFDELEKIKDYYFTRIDLLQKAIEEKNHLNLPLCPEWMCAKGCPDQLICLSEDKR